MLFFSLKRLNNCCKSSLKFVSQSHIRFQSFCTYQSLNYLSLVLNGNHRCCNPSQIKSMTSLNLQRIRRMSDVKSKDCESPNIQALKISAKPPTILIFSNDNEELYHQIYASLNTLLSESTYSFFHISSKALNFDPWQDENIACIFIANHEALTDEVIEKLSNCSKKGIKIISNQSVNSSIPSFATATCNLNFDELSVEDRTLSISDALSTAGFDVNRNHHSLPELSCGYFMCMPDNLAWEMDGLDYGSSMGENPKLLFEPVSSSEGLPGPSSSILPIKVYRQKSGFPNGIEFNTVEYYETLQTKNLGRGLLYIPVCETTMNISKSLRQAMPNVDGIMVVAGCQTLGIGRSGNQWISPAGCAMLTFNYNVPLSSHLGKNATFIQLILAVSICDAIKSLLEIPEFPIKIKWPNDIYYERKYKLGGIIVNSSITSTILQCTIGAGLNVANSKPTICINDLLPSECEKKLTVEEVIAEIINQFEHHINVFENEGKEKFLQNYYNLWLHSNEQVQIQHSSNNEKEMVVIKGLDEYGYLKVQSIADGKIFSVHDDGNTFEMMKGLIRPKYSL